jgi:hypothetical protein
MNEILEVILSMTCSFGFLLGMVFIWIRIEDWWKGK